MFCIIHTFVICLFFIFILNLRRRFIFNNNDVIILFNSLIFANDLRYKIDSSLMNRRNYTLRER